MLAEALNNRLFIFCGLAVLVAFLAAVIRWGLSRRSRPPAILAANVVGRAGGCRFDLTVDDEVFEVEYIYDLKGFGTLTLDGRLVGEARDGLGGYNFQFAMVRHRRRLSFKVHLRYLKFSTQAHYELSVQCNGKTVFHGRV